MFVEWLTVVFLISRSVLVCILLSLSIIVSELSLFLCVRVFLWYCEMDRVGYCCFLVYVVLTFLLQ